MRIKNKALYRSIVIVVILLLSVLAGIVYQAVYKKIEFRRYPREYSEFVEKYSEEFGVPEYNVYGVIKYESSFVSSNTGDGGAIGLMGVDAGEFDTVLKITRETLTSDALYGPETNIKYGTHLLSYLYSRYDSWDVAMLARICGMDTVDGWLRNGELTDENGNLKTVPDASAEKELEKLKSICEKYRELYYGK